MQIEQYKEFLSKMEVLSVQNHIQGQFGVIGSTKVKDWGSSLTPPTPPPPPPPPLPPTQQQAVRNNYNQPHRQEDLSTIIENDGETVDDNQIFDIDIVDGKLPPLSRNGLHHHHPTQQFSHQQSNHYSNNQQHASYYYHNHQNFLPTAIDTEASAMDAATLAAATAAAATLGDNNKSIPTATLTKPTAISNAHYAFNNNLLYSGDNGLAMAAIETPLVQTPTSAEIEIDPDAINELSQRLQGELRTAKSRHLSCTEVSLPCDLTPRIAAEIIRVSEREPCGIRGCSIFIEFEDEPNNIRRIASFKMDPNTVSTFELYLTLKQDKSGWTSLLPQFLKNLTRSNTILISPDFTLTKNKLYSGD